MKYVPKHGIYRVKRKLSLMPISVVRGYSIEEVGKKLKEADKEEERIQRNKELEERLEDLRNLYLDWIEGDDTLMDLLRAMMENGLCRKIGPWRE
jgi:predicted RNase H-like nuclease (RuvC/YqgF family)